MDRTEKLTYITDQLIGQGNFQIIDSAFSDDYIVHAGDKRYIGSKFIKQFATQMRRAIPDISVVKIEIISQTDDVVTWQRAFSGTHKASLKGIPASHKKVKWYEIVVSRFLQDKITEEWVASDLAFQLMLKQ